MLARTILKYLAGAISDLDDSALPESPRIVYPNEPVDESVLNERVFFEVFVGDDAPELETERGSVSSVVGSIVVVGRTNEGVGTVDAIAEALVRAFAPRRSDARRGFSVDDSDDEEGSARAYVASVERSETGVDEGRFKATIFITFDIYEGL